MPQYEYICRGCGKGFEVKATVAQYTKGLRPKCPHCGSRKADRAFSPVNVLTGSRTEPKGPPECGQCRDQQCPYR